MAPGLRWTLICFTALMSLAALVFWVAAAFMGGPRAVIAQIDITAMVLFTMGHLPATASSVLLWRAGTFADNKPLRWALLVSATYFTLACIVSVFGNALAASILGMLT